MTFKDLPRDLRNLPLTDPSRQADVVDLILGHSDRRSGSVALMLCDSHTRPFQPIVVGEVPDAEARACVTRLLNLVAPVVVEDQGGVLVARGRSGDCVLTDDDRALHQEVIDGCGQHGIRLLGCFVATPTGVLPLPEPLTVAS